MARSNLAEIIIYGGGILILYSILKSWGIITTSSAKATSINDKPQFNWRPLTKQELNNLRVKELQVISTNPTDIYKDDNFDVRIGRGKAGYGFVG